MGFTVYGLRLLLDDQGLYRGYVGIMEKKMETTGTIGVTYGLYKDGGKSS